MRHRQSTLPKPAAAPADDPSSTRDSRGTSLAKAVSWRLLASATTVLIAWLITGSIRAGAAIGGVEIVAKFGLYYAHERAWQRFH